MIKIPNYLERLKPLPEDPPYKEIYGFWGENFNAIVELFPVQNQLMVMPYDEQELIDGIHSSLAEDQGLIKVERTKTKEGNEFIYSIIKTYMGPKDGIQYFLRLQMLMKNKFYELCGFFNEYGITGYREATIFAKYREEKKENNMNGWTCDPYDSLFQKGNLMNLSEEQYYDRLFPKHPLTKCRELIEFVKNNN